MRWRLSRLSSVWWMQAVVGGKMVGQKKRDTDLQSELGGCRVIRSCNTFPRHLRGRVPIGVKSNCDTIRDKSELCDVTTRSSCDQ